MLYFFINLYLFQKINYVLLCVELGTHLFILYNEMGTLHTKYKYANMS